MTHAEDNAKQINTASAFFDVFASEIALTTKKQCDAIARANAQLFSEAQETSKQWLDRAHTEAVTASEFASKLVAARSLPEAMAAFQEWGRHHFTAAVDDTRHLFERSQHLIKIGANLWNT